MLREAKVEVEEINYAKRPLDEAQIRAVVKAAGSVVAVLNPRHAVVKEKGWVEAPPAVDAFVRAVLEEPNLLRRPILLRGKTVLVGYDKSNKERWAKLG